MTDTPPLRPVLFYKYNYDYLPPLAMSNGLQLQNIPALDWFAMVAEQALKLLVNKLCADLGIDPNKAEDHQLSAVKQRAQALVTPLQDPVKLLNWRETLKDIAEALETKGKSATRLEDYNELFCTIPLPASAKLFTHDEYFASLRVAGFNPLTLQGVTQLPAKFPLTQALFAKAPGFTGDNLTQALAEKRLYLVDYAILKLQPGQNPAPKQVYQPIGLFGIPKDGGPLKAIAVQGGQNPAVFPIFTPADGLNWEKVRSAFDTADSNYHELISHLGRTHLLMEPFIVATHTQFKSTHPVRRLILPSLEGTDFINGAAVEFLVAPGGPVDKLLMGTIKSDLEVSAQSVQQPGFDALMLPNFLQSQGLMNPQLVYPYRDDALLVWNAVKTWVKDYLALYYANDAAVQKDKQLQNWAADLVSHNGGRLVGFGQKGGIKTLAYLIDALTMVLFTAGPQHAAVNFPQNQLMSYTPAVPLAGYAPLPAQQGSQGPWLAQLPPIDMAALQLQVLYLLGSVYFTRLGTYESDALDAKAAPALKAYQANLLKVEAEITKRNQTRPIPYTYLLPSKIPMSINI